MIEHVWCCECGHETICEPEDFALGSIWHCTACERDWGCVRSKRGPKEWVRLDPASVAFKRIFETTEGSADG